MRIILATANIHKLREMRELFSAVGCELSSLADYPDINLPEETGNTFKDNALAKARAVADATGIWALADDSGLCVDALGGRPGVRSSRYAGCEGNAARNIEKLLSAMKDVPSGKRGAHFICAMALVGPQIGSHGLVRGNLSSEHSEREGEAPRALPVEGATRAPVIETHVVEGRCDGEIAFSPRGEGGFGYDPVFLIPQLGKTFAEISDEEKNLTSHRARAAVLMKEILSSLPA